jgi:dCTP deaminase
MNQGILSDGEIIDMCVGSMVRFPMIEPFLPEQIREIEDPRQFNESGHEAQMVRAISAGVCSYGYDLRLSPNDFRVFHNAHGNILVDPKNFDESLLIKQTIRVDATGSFFVIPGNSYALASTVEYIRMPRDLTAVSVGKSTYARCGIITNVTPFEAAWDGNVTLELANASPAPVKVYANEGICQTLFLRGGRWPLVSYADRAGKYQGQTGLTLAKV